ncbi:MAG: hypothetical protein KDD60_06745 [Bdellovibrionales bacterium]|nr:hypothetical protein [Bdellovibrionales bacterium]
MPDAKSQWYLRPCAPRSIRSTLEDVRSSIGLLKRPLNANAIILDYNASSETEVRERAELLSRHYPGRTFYILASDTVGLPDGSALEKQPNVGGVVLTKSEGKPLFNEFVFCKGGSLPVQALLSIVRANLNVGFSPLLLLFGSPHEELLTRELIQLSSSIVFSSEWLVSYPGVLETLLEGDTELIDLTWIRLSGWRAQLRNLSLKYHLTALSSVLQSIVLRTHGLASPNSSPEITLIAGWLIRQMNSQVTSLSAKGFECLSKVSSQVWHLRIENESSGVEPGLREIEILFGPSNQYQNEVMVRIAQVGDNSFQSYFDSGSIHYRSTGYGREESTLETLLRYFSKGESIALYRDSLVEGQALTTLQEGTLKRGTAGLSPGGMDYDG